MTELTLYNTLSRKKETFTPIMAGKIGLYVCGMTVYDYCHIGHARVLVAFDVITRFLRHDGWDVSYVRNITDIDDKIINRARDNGESFVALADRFIDAMHEDERALAIMPPDKEPRATGHVDTIIDMILTLMDKGYAYKANNGDVYYRVAMFSGYGKLSKKNMEQLLAGARVEVGEAKEDPRDFALWKHAGEGETGWQAPFGFGRPGWHIECSAMTKACLGDHFDIHGGGPDLPFPHHENEIAQSEAANGCHYANYWMHAGAVRLDGEKMSKSLGNFFTIREVLKKYHPEVVRYLLINSHYRSPINYSEDNLLEARAGLTRFYSALRDYDQLPAASESVLAENADYQRFLTAMRDDFNTPVALAVMFDLVRALNAASTPAEAETLTGIIKAMADVLGILQAPPEVFLQGQGDEGGLSNAQIESLVNERIEAKREKNFTRADAIRTQLIEAGIVLEDSAEGTRWRRDT